MMRAFADDRLISAGPFSDVQIGALRSHLEPRRCRRRRHVEVQNQIARAKIRIDFVVHAPELVLHFASPHFAVDVEDVVLRAHRHTGRAARMGSSNQHGILRFQC